MKLEVISGNLLDSDAQYIAHQCNCITTHSAGMAKTIFDFYPYANVYATRCDSDNWKNTRDKPGTIDIRGDGENQRYVINMFAQIFPGHTKFPDSSADGTVAREKYFRKCLVSILKIPDLYSIAFPYGIGCNIAGGNWDIYLKMLEGFSTYVSGPVLLYRKD